MLYVKNGVEPHNLHIAAAAANAAQSLGLHIVITSGTDSVHGAKSLHYGGNALDFRTKNLAPDQLHTFINDVKQRLGPQYDVILESDHLHIEYDPK